MKTIIERTDKGTYWSPGDDMILFFDTEWEARAFYLEVELMDEQGHFRGERPKATMELLLYKALARAEGSIAIKFTISAAIGIVVGLVVGYNI